MKTHTFVEMKNFYRFFSKILVYHRKAFSRREQKLTRIN